MPKVSRYFTRAWVTVGLLAIVACLNYLDRVMLTTMHKSIVAAMPMTEAQFGLLTSVFLWVYASLSPFAGFLADRFSRSRVIIVSLFVWSFVTWLTGQTTNFHELLIVRAIMGISEACYIPAALALIADFHRGSTRSLATGIHMVGISVGSALGGLGGWLADNHPWSYAFSLFGGIGLAYAVVLMLSLRDAPKAPVPVTEFAPIIDKARFKPALVSLFSQRAFLFALLYWGLLGLSGWAFVGWMPTYFLEHFHMTQGEAGLVSTPYITPMAWLGLIVGGAWADHWSKKNERGRIYVPAIGHCLSAPIVILAVMTNHLPVAVGLLAINAFAAQFSNANMMPILCMVSDEKYRATGYGILNFFSCAVGGLAIYLGGALRDMNIPVSVMFEAAAVSMLMCAGLLMLIRPQKTAKAT